jgi:predicted alpha/beta hydrolase
MTQRGIEHLAGFYSQAAARVETIAPHEAGAARIGHFGFFRPQFEATLWPRATAALSGFGAPERL